MRLVIEIPWHQEDQDDGKICPSGTQKSGHGPGFTNFAMSHFVNASCVIQ